MIINNLVIKNLNPCADRYKNYLKFYGDKDFTITKFMGLKNITHADKLWVAFRLLPKEQIPKAAADIAALVLHIYEEKYPNDNHPRLAIEAARRGDAYAANAAYAAYAAAYAAANAAANAAAYAAAGNGRDVMEKSQRAILIKYLKEV